MKKSRGGSDQTQLSQEDDKSANQSRQEFIPKQVVIVWEPNQTCLHLIKHTITECSAEVHLGIELLSLQRDVVRLDSGVALVAINQDDSEDKAYLEAIRLLSENNLKVIAYGDGSDSWHLGKKCQALLAGATRLLDSSRPDFPSLLKHFLLQLMLERAEKLRREESVIAEMRKLGVIGKSQSMIQVFHWVMRVSRLSDLPVLIFGETGTGKELIAQAIYHLDLKRRDGPFIAVNCGAINPSLAESELFGHRRGAYTGAERDRKGLIRAAHGGGYLDWAKIARPQST